MSENQTERRIDIGMDVLGSDGEKLGTVAYVVVQPPRMHMRDIVVSTGALLGRDIVAPMEQVSDIADDGVHLSIDRAKLDRLPDYVEVHYDRPPQEWVPPQGFFYPAPAVLWPAGAAGAYPQPSSVTVNAPAGSVGLREGMEVRSSDGHTVGTIHALEADASGDISEFIVKQGVLFTHDITVPVALMTSCENDRVTLSLSRDEVKARFHKG